jgi:hypothetical protein
MVRVMVLLVLLLFQLPACGWGGAEQVVITGKTVYAGMAIEEVQVRVLRLDGDRWNESSSGRSGYHGAFIVKTNPGMIRLEASKRGGRFSRITRRFRSPAG